MDYHSFGYVRDFLVDTYLVYNLRLGAGLEVLGWVKSNKNVKILLDVNVGSHSYLYLWFFVGRYDLFLGLNKVDDLLNG